jgi:DNA-binding XRE family transcriptional regulator
MSKNGKHPGGRPSDYRVKFNKQAYRLCLLGATDEDMAEFFEVSKQTINTWKQKHPKFLDSIKRGKTQANAEVAERLFERAKGYSHPEDKIFQYEGTPIIVPTIKHYPPDTQAASLWLRNREPARWRDKQELEIGLPQLVLRDYTGLEHERQIEAGDEFEESQDAITQGEEPQDSEFERE